MSTRARVSCVRYGSMPRHNHWQVLLHQVNDEGYRESQDSFFIKSRGVVTDWYLR